MVINLLCMQITLIFVARGGEGLQYVYQHVAVKQLVTPEVSNITIMVFSVICSKTNQTLVL